MILSNLNEPYMTNEAYIRITSEKDYAYSGDKFTI